MADKDIKILQGDEARASFRDSELIHLTNRVNDIECGDVVGALCHQVARLVHRLLKDGARKDFLMWKCDPAFGPIEHMKELRNHGHIAIAKDGGKTVGMIGFEHCNTDPKSGKEVYEIRRIGVRKQYEGQGIASRLHQTMFERVRDIDANARVLVATKQLPVVKQCERMGYEEWSMIDALRMKYASEELPEDMLRYYENQKYRFFVHDVPPEEDASPQVK